MQKSVWFNTISYNIIYIYIYYTTLIILHAHADTETCMYPQTQRHACTHRHRDMHVPQTQRHACIHRHRDMHVSTDTETCMYHRHRDMHVPQTQRYACTTDTETCMYPQIQRQRYYTHAQICICIPHDKTCDTMLAYQPDNQELGNSCYHYTFS